VSAKSAHPNFAKYASKQGEPMLDLTQTIIVVAAVIAILYFIDLHI